MIRNTLYEKIRANLPMGMNNSISARRLAAICGCTTRNLRRAIEEMRGRGELICSCYDHGGGYFYPCSVQETSDYLIRQLLRLKSIWAALRPFKSFVKNLPIEGQIALDELMEWGQGDDEA